MASVITQTGLSWKRYKHVIQFNPTSNLYMDETAYIFVFFIKTTFWFSWLKMAPCLFVRDCHFGVCFRFIPYYKLHFSIHVSVSSNCESLKLEKVLTESYNSPGWKGSWKITWSNLSWERKPGWDCFSTPSNCILKTSSDGDSITSLGRLFQQMIVLTVKNTTFLYQGVPCFCI